ncbi:sporulation integral membrane protein YlbJ [Ornithinibacillus halophilus]|uniref:Sporulation integral membrane protein YlbJ n=1 Tax=Ornithinibacillus halophilus TaxID=930117 RepID=A0A1M5C337_9BACI|nr:sporulation integral membrane protein YlbJ [Ornithinibacillus halophilus]SHF49075.1 sporulation integral membrane protein YlbJ [Ornithinibacillus halophilus]
MSQITKTLLLASSSVFLAFALIIFPKDAFEASIRGLDMWWEVVFPSLLPFFITAELLLSFGVVRFLGVLLEPVMRPLFKVPGVGSFAWTMGMASGYPTGAKISVRLREENQLSQIEAERLVSFTNASSPLFIFVAVSVGFFNDAKLGLLLAACHYIGNALVGVCMRFYGRNETISKPKIKKEKVSLRRAFRVMHETRLKDPRPLGEIMGDAVLNSIKTLVMVGGFIILFSVLTKLLFLIEITPLVAILVESVFQIINLPPELSLPFIAGLFEITIGANMISKELVDPFLANIIIVSFILGFNGFSVQAQVASIISKTDIRFFPYFFARILHGVIASLLTIILYYPLYVNRQVFDPRDLPVSNTTQEETYQSILDSFSQFGPVITVTFIGIAVLITLRRINRNKVL